MTAPIPTVRSDADRQARIAATFIDALGAEKAQQFVCARLAVAVQRLLAQPNNTATRAFASAALANHQALDDLCAGGTQ